MIRLTLEREIWCFRRHNKIAILSSEKYPIGEIVELWAPDKPKETTPVRIKGVIELDFLNKPSRDDPPEILRYLSRWSAYGWEEWWETHITSHVDFPKYVLLLEVAKDESKAMPQED